MFTNLFLRRYAYVLCNFSLNTPTACSLVCFPGMTSSLAKVNKSFGVHFLALFLKFPKFLMFLNIQIDLLIFKTFYGQFTLTAKKLLHIIFKARFDGLYAAGYNSTKVNRLGEIWNVVSQMLGSGHGRLWARSAQ